MKGNGADVSCRRIYRSWLLPSVRRDSSVYDGRTSWRARRAQAPMPVFRLSFRTVHVPGRPSGQCPQVSCERPVYGSHGPFRCRATPSRCSWPRGCNSLLLYPDSRRTRSRSLPRQDPDRPPKRLVRSLLLPCNAAGDNRPYGQWQTLHPDNMDNLKASPPCLSCGKLPRSS